MIDDISINAAEAIPFRSFKEMIILVNQELKKNRYVEIWDKHIYSAEKWRKLDGYN